MVSFGQYIMTKNMIFVIVVIVVKVGAIISTGLPEIEFEDVDPETLNNRSDLIEGDILLPPRLKRQAVISNKRWDKLKPIAFTFSQQFTEEEKNIVRHATNMYNLMTCVKFHENGFNYPIINVVKQGGCYSNIGPVGQKSQLLSLGDNCLLYHLTPLHEFAHVLGLFHEHSRPDRDNFVKVYDQNVGNAERHNFDKHPPSSSILYNPYDYSSFMHYNSHAFSSRGQHTLDAIDGRYQRTMGNSVYASASVFKAVNDYYNCEKVCKFKLGCLNDGYQNPTNCILCNCPEGFGGPLCERRENSVVATCGGDLKATSIWQTLSATLDRRIGRTPFPFSCYFHIKAPSGQRIQLKLETLKMTCSTACSMNNLMINLGENWYTGSMRFCCNSDIEKLSIFTTKNNIAVLALYSRFNSIYFSVKYKLN